MGIIYLLSGPVNSGKTTRLMDWIVQQQKAGRAIGGVVEPVIDNRRWVRDIYSRETRPLEVVQPLESEQILPAGQYLFRGDVLDWARQKILEAYDLGPDWLVIDEVGQLELAGLGLEPEIALIIARAKDQSKTKLLIVVRDFLLPLFYEHYGLNPEHIEQLSL